MITYNSRNSIIRLFDYSIIRLFPRFDYSIISSTRSTRHAFTLVELLVVIGIIGVLASVILAVSGGVFESARAAKCMANMRSLTMASNARAMEKNVYPLAGSREVIGTRNGTTWYNEQVGWISWLSNKGDPYAVRTYGKAKPGGHQTINPSTFYSKGVKEDDLFSLTNGAIWRFTGNNAGVYVCPTHSRYWEQKKKLRVLWSYAMNMRFGYDDTMGSDAAATSVDPNEDVNPGIVKYGEGISRKAKKDGDPAIVVNPDRVLMFAELPTLDMSSDGKPKPHSLGNAYDTDCTLQYKMEVGGWRFGQEWQGTTESIGFNHPVGKREYAGHVAFADGHVEKLTYRSSVGGLKPEELTALLCEGVDLANGANGWEIIDGQD